MNKFSIPVNSDTLLEQEERQVQYLYLHGLGQTASAWEKTVSHMPEPALIACPDLISFLDHREMTYANLYHEFSRYCSDKSKPLDLCGLSLGSILALNYALDHPERVRSLVLIGAQYKMPKALLRFQNVIFRLMTGSTFEKMGFQKNDFIKLADSMANINFSQRLKEISCPALIVCGEKDSANKKAAKELYEILSNAKLCFIEHAGHEINTEKPESLAAVLREFYDRQKAEATC
ncbi:alpha/beta hydrolase [Ruminococcus sp. OA3]|uniref:alpha/beta fold hydrolase n=1 Tax=Ruminococcus sp. OA3 TaxID=2914164 RepID=UPI001F06AFC1|nr:alpha/beta hydrolase [Ruminococcus sp. OA3]MCH1983414.1 alpha/beta hydrolase [Ruminococcus sp. OA3]